MIPTIAAFRQWCEANNIPLDDVVLRVTFPTAMIEHRARCALQHEIDAHLRFRDSQPVFDLKIMGIKVEFGHKRST